MLHAIDLVLAYQKNKIEVPMDIRYSKSGDMTSSGETGLNIRTNASSRMGKDQVSRGVYVFCWLASPVQKCSMETSRNLVTR